MRAWLYPPATGNYTFWLASDDSADLWLSTRPGDPTQARRIATVPSGCWTGIHEWDRFPSQRSHRRGRLRIREWLARCAEERVLA